MTKRHAYYCPRCEETCARPKCGSCDHGAQAIVSRERGDDDGKEYGHPDEVEHG